MDSELDVNKIATKILENKFDEVASFVRQKASGIKSKVSATLNIGYLDYLQKALKWIAVTRSFFVREIPVPIYSFYVPLSLKRESTKIKAPTYSKVISKSKKL